VSVRPRRVSSIRIEASSSDAGPIGVGDDNTSSSSSTRRAALSGIGEPTASIQPSSVRR